MTSYFCLHWQFCLCWPGDPEVLCPDGPVLATRALEADPAPRPQDPEHLAGQEEGDSQDRRLRHLQSSQQQEQGLHGKALGLGRFSCQVVGANSFIMDGSDSYKFWFYLKSRAMILAPSVLIPEMWTYLPEMSHIETVCYFWSLAPVLLSWNESHWNCLLFWYICIQ